MMMVMMLSGKSKVPQLNIVVLVQEDIGGFQVSVDKTKTMQIMQSIDNLTEDLPFLFFSLLTRIVINEVLQVISLTIFHLDVQDLNALWLLL
jgi:hypothetical protein